ncbi:MAG TPA: cobyrinate a,c-diamide synthase [Pseudonocardiaceae bacterium]|nr:cobyrinate a,c-diamide synthase [Pseudonocardiaceae bacterium]
MPRVVVAAPASGSGKTTIATGLMVAMGNVAPFKVGPDYIDPGYHSLATGWPGRNLDPVLVGEERILPLFAHGVVGADMAVIEGVMGLFDGRSGAGGFGSTAHVARLLEAPVLLVVDGRGQGRSLAALLHGFRGYEPGVRLAGVVLNQVGSGRHEEVLREACEEVGLPVLGAVPRGADVGLPSRHLGLIPAVEHGEAARKAVTAMGELITRSVDLAAVRQVAATAGPLTTIPWNPTTELTNQPQGAVAQPKGPVVGVDAQPATAVAESQFGGPVASADARSATAVAGSQFGVPGVGVDAPPDRPVVDLAAQPTESFGQPAAGVGVHLGRSLPGVVVGVAGGAAFTFGYAEHLELLAAAGAWVVVVDPLNDVTLPDDLSALILPGGFPEQHASSLSENTELRAAVARFARSGGIVQAECGGLLYLLDQLDGHPMCGVLPGSAAMDSRLVLGYRDAVAAVDSVAHRAGERRTGHEFHRTTVTSTTARHAWHWRDHDGRPVREGIVRHRVHASYLHTHPAGCPESVARLVSAAARDAAARGAARRATDA